MSYVILRVLFPDFYAALPRDSRQLKCFLLYLLIRPLYPDVVFLLNVQLFTMSKCSISPMLKGLENLEDEIISVVCLIV